LWPVRRLRQLRPLRLLHVLRCMKTALNGMNVLNGNSLWEKPGCNSASSSKCFPAQHKLQ